MVALELDTVILVAGLGLAAIGLPVTAIALHERRRRSLERAAGVRRKERIRL